MAMGAAQTGLNRALNYTPGTFSGRTAQYYMSPYQQAVTDSALREAQRAYDMEARRAGLRAGAGGAGSSAEALMRAEGARNIGQLRSDIQAKGAQSAYESAQAQFERDRAAAAQAAGSVRRLVHMALGKLQQPLGKWQTLVAPVRPLICNVSKRKNNW